MNEWIKPSMNFFESYVDSFSDLSEMQKKNFQIKKDHSLRVAENTQLLAEALGLNKDDSKAAYIGGLFHDVGRFSQLIEYNTFNDAKSVDHAEYSVKVLNENEILKVLDTELEDLILCAIKHHNKFAIPPKLSDRELLHLRLLRDADKLDIYKVLTDYYSNNGKEPNHTLTWELPVGVQVSPGISKDIMSERLVSKEKVKSEIDVKILQLSWVYDLNFKISFEIILKNRFLEKIYETLPKNDTIIEIYRKIKVFSENKLFS